MAEEKSAVYFTATSVATGVALHVGGQHALLMHDEQLLENCNF